LVCVESSHYIFGFLVDKFIFQGCGLAYLIASVRFVAFTLGFFLASVGVTIVLNLVTATLIILRIRYFDKCIGQTLQRNSPYTTIIIICVESSGLIIFFGLIFLILFSVYPIASILPLQMLVHIYVSLRTFLKSFGQVINLKFIQNSYRSYLRFSLFIELPRGGASPLGKRHLPNLDLTSKTYIYLFMLYHDNDVNLLMTVIL
jgi:hypothetical protein